MPRTRADSLLLAASIAALVLPTAFALSTAPTGPDGFPAPRIGDSVTYDVDGRQESLAFEGVETVRTADGEARRTWRIASEGQLWWIDPETAEPLLVGHAESERDTSQPLLGPQTFFRREIERGAPAGPAPCLVLASRYIGNGSHLPACHVGSVVWPGGELAVRATADGAVTKGTARDVVLTIEHESRSPYPAELRLDDVVARRVAYRAGENTSASVAPLSDPPALTKTPRTAWGLDESGTTLLWPLADAYAGALADPLWPDLRDWLADHEGVPVAAAFDAYEVQESRRHTWEVTFADGEERFVLTAYKDLVGGWNVPHIDAAARLWYAGSTGQGPAVDVPLDWPRLADLFGLASSHLPSGFDDLAPDRYAYEVDEAGGLAFRILHDQPSRNNFVESNVEGRYVEASLWQVDVDGNGTVENVFAQREFIGPSGDAPPEGDDIAWPAAVVLPADPMMAWKAAGKAGAVAALAVAAAWALRFLFPLYSRVIGPASAEHPTRARLLQVVAAEPGIHRAELARRLALDGRAVDHHVHLLAKAGLVTLRRSGRYVAVFPAHHAASTVPDVLRMPTARRIFDQVGEAPGIRQGDAATRLGVSPSTMHHHVARLAQAGLLRSVRQGRDVRLFVVAAAMAPSAPSAGSAQPFEVP